MNMPPLILTGYQDLEVATTGNCEPELFPVTEPKVPPLNCQFPHANNQVPSKEMAEQASAAGLGIQAPIHVGISFIPVLMAMTITLKMLRIASTSVDLKILILILKCCWLIFMVKNGTRMKGLYIFKKNIGN